MQRQRVNGGRMGMESKGIGHGGGKAPSPAILATPLPLAIAALGYSGPEPRRLPVPAHSDVM